MSRTEAAGRLSVFLRGGGVLDLPRGKAEIEMSADGKLTSIHVENEGEIEVLYLDASEVVAVVKESDRFTR